MRILATTLMAMIALNAFAWSDPIEKKYSGEYQVNKDATLYINNKYGEIQCQNWDKSVVSIEVTVTVEARNEEKAQRYLDMIDVSLKGTRDRVEGVTSIREGQSFNNVEFSIDYRIMMPKSLSIDFVNKFGEIVLEEVEGPANIEIAYGEFDITALGNEKNMLDVKFSEGDLGYLKGGKVDLSYSELEINGAGDLILDTKFSEIEVDKAESLTLASQYDDYSIEMVGPVTITAQFTDIEIGTQNGDFDYDLQYGELSVDEVRSVKGRRVIENSFADVTLSFATGVAFTVDVETRFGEFDYPSSKTNIRHEEKGYTTHIYSGTFGDGASASDLLYIRSKNGSVYFK